MQFKRIIATVGQFDWTVNQQAMSKDNILFRIQHLEIINNQLNIVQQYQSEL